MSQLIRERLQASLGAAYALDRELGGGGMSHVFVAHDTALGRDVVVKVLPADAAAALSAERFKREIMLAARLQHPHIVPVLSAGGAVVDHGPTRQELPYYTMPFVEGESLRQRLAREGELPVAETIGILREVARALAYAHERGVVHRDIKPDNIMLSGGSAMVTDFGVAKALSASATMSGEATTLTQLGIALGTPAYMAPEQGAAEPTVDHRADLYAFGCTAYEMLTGQPPFSGRPAAALFAAHAAEAPEPVQRRRPSVPPALADLVMRCLEKRPADRPQSANEIVRALDGVVVTPSATAAGERGGGGPARTAAAAAPRRGRARTLLRAAPWLVAAAAVGVAARSAAVRGEQTPAAAPPLRLALPLPDSVRPALTEFRLLAGDTLLAYSTERTSNRVSNAPVVLLDLRSGKASALPGTEGAHALSASPDGLSLAFVAGGQLRRLRLPNGPVEPVAPAKNVVITAWLADGTILLGEDELSTITLVAARGGAKDTLRFPEGRTPGPFSALPDGRVLMSFGTLGVQVLDVRRRSGAQTLTLDGPVDSVTPALRPTVFRGNQPVWLPSGHLAWRTGRRLMFAAFDLRRLRFTGPAVPLADSVYQYAAGPSGTLVVTRGPDARNGVIVIADRSGRRDTVPQPLAQYRTFDVTPDGRRLAVTVGTTELRLIDLEDGSARTWPAPAGTIFHEPRWSPDGERLAVAVTPLTGRRVLVILDPDQAGAGDTVFRGSFAPHAWRPDGEIAGSVSNPGTAYGVLARFRPGVDSAPREVLRLHGNEWYQSFSPDGRWYVFGSEGFTPEATGTYIVEDRPGAIPARVGDMTNPRWTYDGRAIIAQRENRWFVEIPVTWAGGRPKLGRPVTLFDAPRAIDFPGHNLRLLRDGRIVFMEAQPTQWLRAFEVHTNWRAEYERLAEQSRD